MTSDNCSSIVIHLYQMLNFSQRAITQVMTVMSSTELKHHIKTH